MSSGADLFVVCKQCGSEVSPYITECPYCGHRLRRRAPKLPREHTPRRASQRARLSVPSLGRLRRGEIAGVRADSRPYATIALVAASCVVWVLTSGGYLSLGRGEVRLNASQSEFSQYGARRNRLSLLH